MKILENLEILLRNGSVATFVTVSAVHARIELVGVNFFRNTSIRKARQRTEERGWTEEVI